MKNYDFIVVGSGIAGLSFALRASKHGSVAVITKNNAEDTNTAKAQGGISCVQSAKDSFDKHVADTLDAGAGLCPEPVVRTIVSEGPAAIEELIAWGLNSTKRKMKTAPKLLLSDGREATQNGGYSIIKTLPAERSKPNS